MPDWATFAVAIVALTTVLLYLTHRSRRALDRVHGDGVHGERLRGGDHDEEGRAYDGPPRTFDHPDAIDRDFGNDPPVANAVEPFVDDGRTLGEEGGDHGDGEGGDHGDGDEGSAVASNAKGSYLTADLLLANVALSQSLALVAVVVIAWWTDVPASAFGLARTDLAWGILAVGAVAGLALYLGNEAAVWLAELAGVAPSNRLRETMAPTDARGWALLLGVVLPVIAIFEEALFRGALIGAFALGFGIDPWLLAVVSSVVFGLGHGAQGGVGILVTGLLGFALAALFIVTNSLLAVIVAHYVVNALEFVVHEGIGRKRPAEGRYRVIPGR